MYLLDFDILVKQLLPPHWRRTYKEAILKVLLKPFENVFKGILKYRKEVLNEININAQVKVVEDLINRKYAKENYQYITIGDSTEYACVEVSVFKDYENKQSEIMQEVKKYCPMGIKIKLRIWDK